MFKMFKQFCFIALILFINCCEVISPQTMLVQCSEFWNSIEPLIIGNFERNFPFSTMKPFNSKHVDISVSHEKDYLKEVARDTQNNSLPCTLVYKYGIRTKGHH